MTFCPPLARHRRFWLIAALLFVVIRALPNLSYPLGRDQSTYCVIAEGLLRGEHLYQDMWDNKPPGIFFVYALIVKLFGPVMWCVGVVDILWLLVMSYFIFRFAERYLSAAPAAFAVAFNANWHCRANYVFAAQPETFLVLFVFASLFLLLGGGRWPKLRQFGAGLFFGAAFLTKYNALPFVPLLLVIPYLDVSRLDAEPRQVGLVIPWRDWLSRVAVFTVGFASLVAVVLAYFWLSGSWPALKEVQFESLPRYAAMALGRTRHYGLWVLRSTQWWLGIWTECALLASLCIAWKRRDLARFAPIFLAVASGYASVAMQVRFHSYYFETCQPFFAIVWGYLGATIFEFFWVLGRTFKARGWKLARVLGWMVFANVVFWPIPDVVDSLRMHYEALRDWRANPDVFYAHYPWPHPLEHLEGQIGIIHYLKENSSPEDRVFVWGTQPLIYFLSQRRPVTRFVSNLGVISPWGLPAWRRELVRDLEKSPPRFVAVVRKDSIPIISYTYQDSEQYLRDYPGLANFIAHGYQRVETFTDIVVYRREEPSSASR